MKYTTFFLIPLLSVFFFARIVSANGFGVTLDQVSGDYTANVDHDAVGGIFAGDPVQFAFQLFNKDRSKLTDFTDVWVSIVPKDANNVLARPIFDGGIFGSGFPPAGMTFVFLAGGSYDLKLRFDKGGKTLAEAVFPLTVKGDEGKNIVVGASGSGDFFKGALTTLILGILIGLAVRFFGRKKT